MTNEPATAWSGAVVRKWLESRVAAARADQVVAERGDWSQRDDCDKASAEEMVCATLQRGAAADDRAAFGDALRILLARDDYIWRGINDDARFDRHVRTYIRKLVRMTKTNAGFERTGRYQ